MKFAKLRAFGTFVPYVPSHLTRLRAFVYYVSSCLKCLRALRALIFTRLNYAPCALYLLTRLITHVPLNVTNFFIKVPFKIFYKEIRNKGAVFDIK